MYLAMLGVLLWIFAGVVTINESEEGVSFGDGKAAVSLSKPWYDLVLPGVGTLVENLIPQLRMNSGGTADSPEKRSAPRCTITATPPDTDYGGQTTISWTTLNARHAILQDVGEVPLRGSYDISNVVSTRALVLAIEGDGGVGMCYTVVNVGALVTKR
ncbi:MAG: OmpA/MotB domain protein [Candidatus Kaiserbacteria bacterium GW2011_GWB1_52_6]|nr:MAG: OmpA/MotB domain protein [Candidatus Kaiserbacteria bacterium GW2011_GWB1_52_6]